MRFFDAWKTFFRFENTLMFSKISINIKVCFTCVPGVVAAGPWELRAEGKDQVEKSPCQNNDVRHTAVEDNELPTIADTCTTRYGHFPTDKNLPSSIHHYPKHFILLIPRYF